MHPKRAESSRCLCDYFFVKQVLWRDMHLAELARSAIR
jgi:hypothetical protein